MATEKAAKSERAAQPEKAVSTVPDQIKKGFEAGTEARATVKKIANNAKYIAGTAVGIIFLIGMITTFIPYLKDEVRKDRTEDVVAQNAEPGARITKAIWKEPSKDGSLPVGVWSQTFSIGVGCRTHYDGGNGTDFKVRYRLYSPEWKDHPGGNNYPPANEVQFMLLKPRAVVPVKVTCS